MIKGMEKLLNNKLLKTFRNPKNVQFVLFFHLTPGHIMYCP